MTVRVVLVDPMSSGMDLAQAFRERGVEPFHVYQRHMTGHCELDPAPGGKLLHESVSETCTVLKDLGAQAVLAGSETGVPLADELAAGLGLPHNTPRLAPARASKLEEVRALWAAGVPCARTEEVVDPAGLDAVLARFDRYPLVVKPVASAGSDGLAICAGPDEVRAAVEGLLGHRNAVGSINDSVLVQEHLAGPQFIVNTVSVGGRHVLWNVELHHFEEVGGKPIARHTISRRELDVADRGVVDYCLRCLDALGLENGAGHTEIRLTDRGPRLIEVNFRLMGPCLPADIWVPALGSSHATLFAESVLGTPGYQERANGPYTPPDRHLGAVFMRAGGSGRVLGMPGLERIRRLATFRAFARLPRLGTEISNPLMTTGSGGMAYFTDPDVGAVLADIARVHDLVDSGQLYAMSG